MKRSKQIIRKVDEIIGKTHNIGPGDNLQEKLIFEWLDEIEDRLKKLEAKRA
jgi:hypothetical protein